MAGARFYFDWANYFTMLKLLRADPNPARRRKLLAAFLLGVPLLAAVHTVCFALDPLLFGSLRRTEVREPVFAVGHARSGTTYLHRLMAKDDQFSVVLLYEMLFPSLLEKQLLRLVFRLDERVLGGRLRRRIDEAEQRAMARIREAQGALNDAIELLDEAERLSPGNFAALSYLTHNAPPNLHVVVGARSGFDAAVAGSSIGSPRVFRRMISVTIGAISYAFVSPNTSPRSYS